MFFFYNLPHTAGKAQASRLQQRKTCIIKCFSRVPKHPISFSMCIKNSSLLHTAAEDRASVYFLGGYLFFFHRFPHTAAKARASDDFFDMCSFFTRGCRSPQRLEKDHLV